MKEIKFRAFSKISKKFVDWDDMAIGPVTPKENYKDGMVYMAFPPDGMLQECNEHDFTFQLYTGLKDKGGKEIYEGDIIKVDNELIKVEWLDWCAGFYPFNELNDDYERAGINPQPENCEVIGNTFENPELIIE